MYDQLMYPKWSSWPPAPSLCVPQAIALEMKIQQMEREAKERAQEWEKHKAELQAQVWSGCMMKIGTGLGLGAKGYE